MKIGGLFAGIGGLEQGIAGVWPDAEPVWFSEIDKAASAVLAYRYPGVVNHGDITTIDWSTVEPVDVLCGGWPCQPFSSAGKRKGTNDVRALWPALANAVRVLRPAFVVLENVAAITVAGELGRAIGDLANIGYVGSWQCLRASDVGATHQRTRIFVTCWPAADTENVGHQWRWQTARRRRIGSPYNDFVVADTTRGQRQGPQPMDLAAANRPTAESRECVSPIAWGAFGPAIRRWETILGRSAPAPTIPVGRRKHDRLSARFVEWMMGYPDGWVTDVPGLTNNDALRCCGNGVVPHQAAAALRLMLDDTPPIAA